MDTKSYGSNNQCQLSTLDCAFPSSYLAERGFSAVANLLSKKRNRLQITERGDLRLMLIMFKPEINKLLKLHQVQPSH